MNGEVEQFHNVFGLVCRQVEPVDGHVVVEMAYRIEALALDRADRNVIGLARPKLTGLSDVSSVIRAEAFEWHP